jgi:hypothetical protein
MTKIYYQQINDCCDCPMYYFDHNICIHPDSQQEQECPKVGTCLNCPLPDFLELMLKLDKDRENK